MPPPPRRRPDSRDPHLSGMILDAEVLDADILDAEVLDADILDAEVLDASVVDAVIEAEVLDAEAIDDEPPVVFDLDAIDGPPIPGTAPAASLPVYESLPRVRASSGADLLSLDADPPRPATRTASRPATAARPAVRITFVAPGEASPFAPRG